ncbi:hypothetical protein GCWU000341_01661 [Oribacterium sp. oral taxon 078 str. F0262]|uniref:anti-sigma-I factor RsgI family protein n=1 Tax=Oribacterium sp. oral taxon 078 TaxID=652706 RepID=UPI0001BCB9C3|nr:hypothetical protein [Oribacterium sp. oral taxon 078]EFE91494.1 hypothetical protein GCWU000341_01661 [Oribacterium sp. oral taxon 078 str. F0262]
MKSLSERQINDHIRRAASAMTPKYAEELWEKPVEKADGDAWFLDGTKQKRKRPLRRYMRWTALAAACFAIVFISWFQLFHMTDATIYLDVNPSISVDVNCMGRVLDAAADNEDGRILLDQMNLRNADIDAAMSELLTSMVRHGYLSRTQNTLLLSVSGRNEKRAEALRQRISSDAEQALSTLLGQGIILEQNVDPDDTVDEISEHYGITPGKAALILKLLKDRPSWDLKELAGMPMADLIRSCQTAGIDISHYLGEGGEVIGDLNSLLDPDERDRDDDNDDDPDRDDDRENHEKNQPKKEEQEDHEKDQLKKSEHHSKDESSERKANNSDDSDDDDDGDERKAAHPTGSGRNDADRNESKAAHPPGSERNDDDADDKKDKEQDDGKGKKKDSDRDRDEVEADDD